MPEAKAAPSLQDPRERFPKPPFPEQKRRQLNQELFEARDKTGGPRQRRSAWSGLDSVDSFHDAAGEGKGLR